MKVYTNSNPLPVFNKAVVTIGTFDGVHKGHRKILAQLKDEAARVNGETVLITFDPHPRKIVSKQPLQLLNTLSEKIKLLEEQGIDNLVVIPFTAAFAHQSAEEYVEEFLVKKFHPHTVIIGYDHRFGKDRSGDFHLLESFAEHHAFELIEIPEHVLNQVTISSTRIREALLSGHLKEANDFLGYPYFFEGTVVEGNKLGRTLGYPTANLRIEDPEKLVPGNGVYAVEVVIGNDNNVSTVYKGMMNIGIRPTVDGTKRMIEVNIFSFDKDIYGETLKVSLCQYLRGEQKFSGLDALKEQLSKDKTNAINYFEC